MDMWLPKVDIYQRTVASNCFKRCQISDVRSEIHLV